MQSSISSFINKRCGLLRGVRESAAVEGPRRLGRAAPCDPRGSLGALSQLRVLQTARPPPWGLQRGEGKSIAPLGEWQRPAWSKFSHRAADPGFHEAPLGQRSGSGGEGCGRAKARTPPGGHPQRAPAAPQLPLKARPSPTCPGRRSPLFSVCPRQMYMFLSPSKFPRSSTGESLEKLIPPGSCWLWEPSSVTFDTLSVRGDPVPQAVTAQEAREGAGGGSPLTRH